MNEYTWRVMKHNRFAGYVLAVSEWEALRKANDYYGKYVWVERLMYQPKQQDCEFADSQRVV